MGRFTVPIVSLGDLRTELPWAPYLRTMDGVTAALYIDFDNVFSGLLKLDPKAALAFAEAPTVWLDGLSTAFTVDGPRRWLVRRCYMNPAGSVPNPDPTSEAARLYFSRFRPFFTRAGFEVIDCPALTSRYKNAADIRMVLDAMDALGTPTAYDEFVVASADSDLTPLLVRLRAAGRRTTIVSPSDAAVAFTAIADRLVDGEQVLALLQEKSESLPSEAATSSAGADAGQHPQWPRCRDLLRSRYCSAAEPLNMASLAHEVQEELGPVARESNWFDYGSFAKALEAADLADMRTSQNFLWDSSRHLPPKAVPRKVEMPDAVARVCAINDLPRLARSTWPHVYESLAEFARTHEFNLSEATKWSRDRLVERGFDVGRGATVFVARGTAFGGAPLHTQPAPTAEQIAVAFVSNVLKQAHAAQVGLTDDEASVVAGWLGAPGTTGL